MRQFFLLLFVLCLAACAWLPGAGSSEGIGSVEAVIGEPRLIRGGTSFTVEPGVLLKVADAVITGPADAMALRMSDKTVMTLAARTELVFHIYSDEKPTPLVRMSLGMGAISVVPGRLPRNERGRFEIVTPVADVLPVEGEVWLRFSDQLDFVMLSEGKVSVVNLRGRAELNSLGEGLTTLLGESPSEPALWQPDDITRAMMSTTLEGG